MGFKHFLQMLLFAGVAVVIFGMSPNRTAAQISGGGLGGGGTGGGGTGGTNPPTIGTLTIYLPAKTLLTPDQLRIGNAGNVGTNTYTFQPNSNPRAFNLTSGTNTNYTVTVTCHTDNNVAADCITSSDQTLGYTITVAGFVKGGGQLALDKQKGSTLLAKVEEKLQNSFSAKAFAPPFPCFAVCAKIVFPYRLTFKSGTGTTTLPKATVNNYVSYLQSQNNNKTDTFISSDQNCSIPSSSGAYLCLKENTKFDSPEALNGGTTHTTGPVYTLQSIPLGITGSINVQGNAAAAGDLFGFSFNALSNSVAIGGNVDSSVQGANKTLQSYISQNATLFAWAKVKPQLDAIFAKRTKGTVPHLDVTSTTFCAPPASNCTWNLNSSTNDPLNAAKSSFSSPPEGKLWYTPNGSAFLRFPSNVTFSGSGTIAVDGAIEFDGNITCSPGTRLGIIASGQVSFSGSTIGCGAYTTLGANKDIYFGFQVTSNGQVARGIFVSANSVHLPSLIPPNSYSINYDDTFGNNPTVLYAELLKVVFSSSN